MLRRILPTMLSLFVLLVCAGTASAATPEQIHRDAADGSIDGTYTLSEMRAADRTVSAEQREYYGWEDVYSAYVRTLSDPSAKDEVVPAVAVDLDRDGTIEPAEVAAARKKTRAKCTKATPKAQRSKVCKALGIQPVADVPDEAEPKGDDTKPASDADEDDGSSPLLWLIIGIPLLIVALGAWRMRGRGKGDPTL